MRIRTEIQNQKNQLIELIGELISKNLDLDSGETENLAKQIYLLYESAVAESHLHQQDWPIHQAKGICKKIV